MPRASVPEGTIQFNEEEIIWKQAPPNMPAGTRIAILEGNPQKEGMFTIRLKAPKNMRMQVHQHPGKERVTILAGVMYVSFGKKYDENKATSFGVGSYYVNPSKQYHYVFTKDAEAIAQITGMGPWLVSYKE